MIIGGLQKTTLIDYPGKVACLVFTVGCNFRCGYCHNPELHGKKDSIISAEDFFQFLKDRRGKLEGVVITGGEPTIQPDLPIFIEKIKELNYLVKLDTQGSLPNVVDKLLKNKLLDYIAMDIKAPINKYREISNSPIDGENILQSINLIKNSGIDYEFRTTIVKEQLSVKDIKEIGKLIKGAKRYYLQKFIPGKVLDSTFSNKSSYTDCELEEIKKYIKKFVSVCEIR
jgi:pyruvate formate lyase activating enzyme